MNDVLKTVNLIGLLIATILLGVLIFNTYREYHHHVMMEKFFACENAITFARTHHLPNTPHIVNIWSLPACAAIKGVKP